MTIQKNKLIKAFTLVEVLGATAVIATLATVSVVSIRDSVQAGQKAAAQREIQSLNTALQNFKSAGGVIPVNSSMSDVDAAIDALLGGTELEGSQFTPLASRPPMEIDIGGSPYVLSYDPEEGFSYVDANGEGIGFSGQAVASSGSTSPYPFNIDDPAAIAAALEDFALLDPSDSEYQSYLDGFAAALQSGELDDATVNSINSAMGDQGLVYDPETLAWVAAPPVTDPQVVIADNVASLLSGGSTWGSLTPEQQTAYANVYPAQAVTAGGVAALNIMDPSKLTAQIVTGYGNVNGTWINTATPVTGGTTYVAPSSYQSKYSNTASGGLSTMERDHIARYKSIIPQWDSVNGAPVWKGTHSGTADNPATMPAFVHGKTYKLYMATDPTQPATQIATATASFGAWGMQNWSLGRTGTITGYVNADGTVGPYNGSNGGAPVYADGAVVANFSGNGASPAVVGPPGATYFWAE